MKPLLPVLVGILAFLILYWVDFFDLKRKPFLKILTWFFGIVLLIISHLTVIFDSTAFLIPEFFRLPGFILSILFFTLLIYSVFIEIPLFRKKGVVSNEKGLITSGTYALTRHPGVIWYLLTLTAILIYTGSKSLLISIPIWGLMDIIYALIQDYFFFPRLFGEDYCGYKEKTPMLIPSFSSMRTCILSYREFIKTDKEVA